MNSEVKVKTTEYAGIDYGLGQSNRNTQTGIRFGVISQHDLNHDCTEDIWRHGTDLDYEDYIAEAKQKVRSALSDYFSDSKYGGAQFSKLDIATDDAFDAISDNIGDAYESGGDCSRMLYERDGMRVQTDSNGDLWVFESPYFTYAQFCSPCAPGACYLANPLSEPIDANKCYCFDHSWFEGQVAPYPVYSVKTGELIKPTPDK